MGRPVGDELDTQGVGMAVTAGEAAMWAGVDEELGVGDRSWCRCRLTVRAGDERGEGASGRGDDRVRGLRRRLRSLAGGRIGKGRTRASVIFSMV